MSDKQETNETLLEWGARVLTRAADNPRLEAELLLASVTGDSRSALVAWPERPVPATRTRAFHGLIQRRQGGEPVAYLLGKREFWSLELETSPAVLIPRPETETLVERALDLLPAESSAPVLDLGTGSGAIALALAAERPRLEVIAVDRSIDALAVARRNAERLGLPVHFIASNWFDALARRQFRLIVTNPPYVPSEDPHLTLGDVRFEPRRALDGGPDGLQALREIIAAAPGFLLPGGTLLLEHGVDQGPAVLELLQGAGFSQCTDYPDLAGQPRVAQARWCGPAN